MSAICGWYNLKNKPIDRNVFDRVLSALDEYGLDGSGRWCDDSVALAHQMTWLTPQSRKESLPFCDSHSNLAITADARVDNRDDLCASLSIPKSQRSSMSDSQLILRTYQEWGPDCPKHLLGDFAFTIWDHRKRRLFCARDILGVRPFYFHFDSHQFIFASDLCGVLAAPGISHELDLAYVSAHFRHAGNYPHDTHTWYSRIKKLARGHSMIVDTAGIRTWAYWNPEDLPEVRCKSDGEYAEMLRDLLDKSVRARIRSTYPVGAHLSGGLDSSSVAVLATRMLRERGEGLTGFSWAPPPTSDAPQDERAMVEQLCHIENIPVHYTQASFSDNAVNRLRNLGKRRDAGFVHELVVRRTAASQGIRGILSGWGGDELIAFNGRGYFADLLCRGRWLRLWRESRMRSGIHGDGGALWKWIVSRAVFPLLPDWIFERFYRKALPAFWDESPLPDVFVSVFRAQLSSADSLPRKRGRERAGVRTEQLGLLAHGHLTERIEGWAAAGGRMGITYAYPLLDRRIVELALGLPPEMFFKNGWKRFLFRYALEGILPNDVRWEKSKKEPALNDDRDRIRDETQTNLPKIVDQVLNQPRDYHFLDIEHTRRKIADVLATEHNANWTPGEEPTTRMRDHFSVLGGLLVEIMANPELDCDIREHLEAVRSKVVG